jgi:hypothetical protein
LGAVLAQPHRAVAEPLTNPPAAALLCAVVAVSNPESMMLSAGVLPAVEQLFRQIPVASPAHVAAADLLVRG